MIKKMTTAPKPERCLFNEGVICSEHYQAKCAKCGWNPEVAQTRIENKCYVRKESDK